MSNTRTQALLDKREIRGGNERGLQPGSLDTTRRVWYQGINWLEAVCGHARVKSYRIARPILGVVPINLDLAYHFVGHYGRDYHAHVSVLKVWKKQARC